MASNTTLEEIQVSFPATAGHLALSRVNATTAAAMLDFDIDSVEDLRLAVTEAVTWLLDGSADDGRIDLRISGEGGVLRFIAERTGATGGGEEMDELSSAILAATVDDCTHRVADDVRRIEFTKSPGVPL